MNHQKPALVTRHLHQGGNILITVIIVMLVTTLLAGAIVQHFLVSEARAVEESLAKVRVYWAMSGHANYVHSRARHYINTCGDATDPTLTNFVTAFNTFSFDPDTEPTTCASVTACDDAGDTNSTDVIMRCFVEELQNNADETRLWVYDSNYTLSIRNAPPLTDSISELQFRLAATGDIAVLNDLGSNFRSLYIQAGFTSKSLSTLKSFRAPPSGT